MMSDVENADETLIDVVREHSSGRARDGHVRAAALRYAAAVLRARNSPGHASDLDAMAIEEEKVVL